MLVTTGVKITASVAKFILGLRESTWISRSFLGRDSGHYQIVDVSGYMCIPMQVIGQLHYARIRGYNMAG